MFGLPRGFSRAIKFVVGLLLLPPVYSFTVSFINELNSLKGNLALYFWGGLASFAIVYIFIYQPELIYNYGQEMVKVVFAFFKPLSAAAAYVVPIYTVILFLVYGVLVFISGAKGITEYFLLLIGFSWGLHLVFTAKALNSVKKDFLKADYIFGFFSVYLIDLVLVAFASSLTLRGFSFINFFAQSFQASADIFNVIFNKVA